jgi:6,7-dimethyl-8-ribityllumazine synthase
MKRVLIIQAVFYKNISEMLLNGAISKLRQLGYEYEVITLKGALEIAPCISMVHNSTQAQNYLGYIALGCVIRGETSHYDIVCNNSSNSISYLATKYGLAITNGIITVENENQAIIRADINQKDKGGFCAQACVDLIKIKEKFI